MIDSSLFVSDSPQEREVTLADGSKHVLHFKELPAVEFRKYSLAEASEDEEIKSSSLAKLIAASLCSPDGKPAITVAQAKKLKPMAANAIYNAMLDVCGFNAKNG